MRSSPLLLLLALPALTCAQQQFPFLDQIKGFFNKASASISSSAAPAVPSPDSIPNPIAAGAKATASANVERLTLENWQQKLQPGAATASPGIEDWMIFVTGGNTTCYGMCARAETAWNESTALISAQRNPPNLAMLDCETDPVLCNAWAVGPPTVAYFQIPQPLPDQSTPATTVRFIGLNRTSVDVEGITGLSLQEKYKDFEPYEGLFHPFDGQLAKLGLAIPVGYITWGFGKIPSWAFMIGVSMISRNMMSRRMNQQRPGAGAPGAAPAS